MGSLGSFGTKKIAVKAEEASNASLEYDTITWFDETIRLRPWFNPFSMSKFSKVIANDRLRVNIEATSAILEVLQACVLEEDWLLFEALGQDNDATIDVMEEVAEHLLVLWTRRPTQPVSGSSTGAEEKTEDGSNENLSSSAQDLPQPDSSENPTSEPELVSTN